MSQPDKSWKTMIDIASGSFVTLEIEGRVECSASWDTIFHAVWSGSTLHISTNVTGHPGNPCIQKICILRTAYYILRSFKNSTWHCEQPPLLVPTHTHTHTHTCTHRSCSYRAARPWWGACFQRERESWGALQSEELKHTHTHHPHTHTHQRESVIFTKWNQAPLMKHTLSPSLCPHVRDWMSKLQHLAINISARIVLVSPVLSFLFFLTFFPYPSILPTSLSLQIFLSPCGHDAPNSSSFPSSQRCVRVFLSGDYADCVCSVGFSQAQDRCR